MNCIVDFKVYQDVSNGTSDKFADELGISRPVAKRAVAPQEPLELLLVLQQVSSQSLLSHTNAVISRTIGGTSSMWSMPPRKK